jgi:sortase A
VSSRRPDAEASPGDVPPDRADREALRARLQVASAVEDRAAALEERVAELEGTLAAQRRAREALERRLHASADGEPAVAPPATAKGRRATRARTRIRHRRGLRFLPALMITTGVLLSADAVLTVAWQEPLTALWASHQQDRLSSRLDRIQGQFALPAQPARRAAPDRAAQARAARVAMARAARRLGARAHDGDPVGRLTIPAIGKKLVVLQGTQAGDLSRGPGHYDGTALPGQTGTFGVAGHRTTYAAPFRKLDELRKGDRIIARMPYGRFTYRVQRTQIVSPQTTSVLRPVAGQRIVLTACHPLYSAAKRIVVTATLAQATPISRAA